MGEHVELLTAAYRALAAAIPSDPSAATADDLSAAMRAAAEAEVVVGRALQGGDASAAPVMADWIYTTAMHLALTSPGADRWVLGWRWVARVADVVRDALVWCEAQRPQGEVAGLLRQAFGLGAGDG